MLLADPAWTKMREFACAPNRDRDSGQRGSVEADTSDGSGCSGLGATPPMDEELHIVIYPLSPGMFSRPAATTGAITHLIGFANALASSPQTRVRLLYPRGAEASAFSGRVEIVAVDVPSWLQKPAPLCVWVLLWNVFALYVGLRLIVVSHLRRRGAVDVIYARFSASVVLPLLLLRVFMPSTLFLFEINTPAAISAADRHAVARWVSRMIDKATLAFSSGVFVVTEELRSLLVEQHGQWVQSKVLVNANGVNPKRFRPLGDAEAIHSYREALGIVPGECAVGYAGKALPHHHLDLLARVIGEVCEVPLRMVVAGNMDSICVGELEKLGRGKVTLVGEIPYERVPLFLNAADILALPHGPSYGCVLHQSPIKLFEYMAVGKPVVASRIGEMERVIRHNENGVLVGPNDASNLKHELVRLAKDSGMRQRLGKAARDTVTKQYSWDHNASRVLAAIESLRCRRSRPRQV